MGAYPGWWSHLCLCWTLKCDGRMGVCGYFSTDQDLICPLLTSDKDWTGKKNIIQNEPSWNAGLDVLFNWVFILCMTTPHISHYSSRFVHTVSQITVQWVKYSLSGLWNQVNISFLPSRSFLSVFSKKQRFPMMFSHTTWISACLWPSDVKYLCVVLSSKVADDVVFSRQTKTKLYRR